MVFKKILRKYAARQKEARIIFLGLDNAGKTTVAKRLNNEDISQISPTLGFAIYSLDRGGMRLNIWDVGGQRTIRPYWRNYFEKTDGLVWVVDSADVARLEDCRDSMHSVLKEEKLSGAPMVILANKQDLLKPNSKIDIASILCVDQIKNREVKIFKTSASDGQGIEEGIDWVIDVVKMRLGYTLPAQDDTETMEDLQAEAKAKLALLASESGDHSFVR